MIGKFSVSVLKVSPKIGWEPIGFGNTIRLETGDDNQVVRVELRIDPEGHITITTPEVAVIIPLASNNFILEQRRKI